LLREFGTTQAPPSAARPAARRTPTQT
jgi:hypothetical protein